MLTMASPAFAATANEKKADALYNEGSQLFQKGRYEDALKRLEESMFLDPGTGTLVLVASCREKLGQWRQAYVAFRDAKAQSVAQKREDRIKYAEERMTALREHLVTLIVTTTGAVPGETLTIDDAPYAVVEGDEGMILDQGDHKLVYGAPNMQTQRMFLRDLKGTQRVVLLALQPLPVEAPKPAPASHKAGVSVWAWAAGGAGVALVGTAVVLQLGALSDASKSEDAANAGDKQRRDELHRSATSGQTWALVLGGAGVALTGVGVYGILTAPKAEPGKPAAMRLAPWLGGGTTGLSLSGGW